MSKVSKEDTAEYEIHLIKDPSGYFFVEIPDLLGCTSIGETIEEALANIEREKQFWIKEAKKQGRSIPSPHKEREYSGKLLLRLGKKQHEELSKQADRQGMSLNAYLKYLIANGQRAVEYQAIYDFISGIAVTLDKLDVSELASDIRHSVIQLTEKETRRIISATLPMQEPEESNKETEVTLKVIEGGRK